jgi:hypothetical protein
MFKKLISKTNFLMLLLCLISAAFLLKINADPVQSYTDFFIRGAHSSLASIYSWSPEGYGANVGGSIWRLAPLSLIYVLFTNVLEFSSGVSQFIICTILFLIGFLGYIKIIPKLLNSFNVNNIAVKLTGLFYIFNTYTLIQFTNSYLLVIPYLLLPIQICLLIKAFENDNRAKYIILFALVNGSCFGINLIFDVISLLVLCAVGFFLLYKGKNVSLRELALFFVCGYGLTFMICSFWLVPQIYSSVTDTQNTQYVLQSEQFYNSDSSLLRVIRGLGDWSFYSGQNSIPYNSFANAYKNNIAVIISGYIIPLLAILSIFVVRVDKRLRKKVTWLLSGLVVTMIAIIGTYPGFPTSLLAEEIFNHIPFAMAFRNTYKFASIEMLLLCLLSTISLSVIFNKLASRSKFLVGSAALAIAVLICINAFPFFSNQLYSSASQIKSIPAYWTETADYINDSIKKNQYVFMLPNQYFEAFIWNSQFKSFPRNLEETLFKPSAVHDNCSGCGQYLTSNFLTYVYGNLTEPGIFKLLGLTGNSLIVQRNDYDYKYYGVQSPSQIHTILSDNKDVKKIKTYGELDTYKINTNDVNSIFYSPKRIVTTNDINDFAPIISQNDRSTALILSSTIKNDDPYTFVNSNFYQGVFSTNNTSTTSKHAASNIYTPRKDDYKLSASSIKTNYRLGYSFKNGNYTLSLQRLVGAVLVNNKEITANSNTTTNVALGNYGNSAIAIELDQNSYLLEPNHSKSDLADFTLNPGINSVTVYSTTNVGPNLVSNGSLENGLWQPKVEDCDATTANAPISMKLVKGAASSGNNYLQLEAKQDSACTYTPPLNNFQSGTYLFSVDTRKVTGSNPAYCAWNGKACVAYSEIESNSTWATYSNTVYLGSQASNFYLYLYAQKANYSQSVEDYDNVRIYRLTKPLKDISFTLQTINNSVKTISLGTGKQIFQTPLELNSLNLVDNPSFNGGPWQSTVQNCTDQSGINNLGMKVVNNTQEGSALDLSTNGIDTACTNSAYINNFGSSSTYLLRVKYKVVSGKSAKICIWNGRTCVETNTFTPHDNLWHTAYELITPSGNFQPLSVYLYAPSGGNSEVQYTGISINEVENSFINSYTLSNVNVHTINAGSLSFSENNPTRYYGNMSIKSGRPTLLVFSQSYHPDWKAYIVTKHPTNFFQSALWDLGIWKRYEIPDQQHIVANGFSNGWWINTSNIPSYLKNSNNNYNLVIYYTPQSMVDIGLVVSAVTVALGIAYLVLIRRPIDKSIKSWRHDR